MCCSFIPLTLLQRLVEDESLSDEARQEVQSRIDEIGQTLSSLAAGANPQIKYKTRYTEVPGGFKEFRSAIWGMATKNIDEFDYKTGEVLGTSYQPLPGIPYRTSQEPPVEDEDVNTCMEGLRTTYNFYQEVFGRNSVDDDGLQLEASIHYSIRFANAFWDGGAKQMIFGDGDGNSRFGRFAGIFNPGSFVQSLDVIAHELTHAVTQFTAGLVYQGQSGALNESISDVFGSMVVQWKHGQTVEQADWLMGRDIIYQNSESVPKWLKNSRNLRSLKDPESLTNFGPQPASMKSRFYYRNEESTLKDHDYGGVHTNSGVPNHAFYKVAVALGGHSWERAGKIWYATLTDKRLQKRAKFVDFARLTVEHAETLYNADTSVVGAVQKAWKDVGVL